jgi:hypothetical protein
MTMSELWYRSLLLGRNSASILLRSCVPFLTYSPGHNRFIDLALTLYLPHGIRDKSASTCGLVLYKGGCIRYTMYYDV